MDNERLDRLEKSVLEIQGTLKELKDELEFINKCTYAVFKVLERQFPTHAKAMPIKIQTDDIVMMLAHLMDKLDV